MVDEVRADEGVTAAPPAVHPGTRPPPRAGRGPAWSHAQTYRGLSPAALVHRARLRRLVRVVRALGLPPDGLVADLGCSDGFVLAALRDAGAVPPGWHVAGYDRSARLVRAARARGMERSGFSTLDLTAPGAAVADPADVVLCLETLEHVGDFRAALQCVDSALRPGGRLVLSMPNEVGVTGLLKLLGRPLLRRRPYEDFFSGRRQMLGYALAVATRRPLEPYRSPARPGWGPHLGFDHRAVTRHVQDVYVSTGRWRVDRRERAGSGSTVFLVVTRSADAGPALPRPRSA